MRKWCKNRVSNKLTAVVAAPRQTADLIRVAVLSEAASSPMLR